MNLMRRTRLSVVIASTFLIFCGGTYGFGYDYEGYQDYERGTFYQHHLFPGQKYKVEDYVCLFYKTELECYPDNATVVPGASWRDVKQKWGGPWWDYPCFYYTEQALLSLTDDTFNNTSFMCQGHKYFWRDNDWIVYEYYDYYTQRSIKDRQLRLEERLRSNTSFDCSNSNYEDYDYNFYFHGSDYRFVCDPDYRLNRSQYENMGDMREHLKSFFSQHEYEG